MAPGVLITAVLFWTGFYVLLSTILSISQASNKGLLLVYLRLIVPICCLFCILTIGQAVSNEIRIFVGFNFLLSILIMVGRYQFIRAVIEGETYRADRNALEIIPLILGVLGYVFIQISLNFKVESPLEIKGIGATSFQTVVEIPFMKLIYVLMLNIDIFLTVSQGILMSEYKVLGQFADRIRKIHLFSMIGIIGRVLVYGGAIILDYTMHSMGVLLALAVLALVIIQLLLLDTDEFPKLTKEIKETATAEERTWSDLTKGLQTHQWYLEFNLKFHEVAERLDISPARLRKSIQAHSDLNFTELINVHRIDYLMDLKDQFDLNEIPIDELARRCGFKSRVTLYRATIKWLNVTPSHASDFEGKFNLHKHLIK